MRSGNETTLASTTSAILGSKQVVVRSLNKAIIAADSETIV